MKLETLRSYADRGDKPVFVVKGKVTL
jgi:hypothetical protein